LSDGGGKEVQEDGVAFFAHVVIEWPKFASWS